jgi:hypothetical protein
VYSNHRFYTPLGRNAAILPWRLFSGGGNRHDARAEAKQREEKMMVFAPVKTPALPKKQYKKPGSNAFFAITNIAYAGPLLKSTPVLSALPKSVGAFSFQ